MAEPGNFPRRDQAIACFREKGQHGIATLLETHPVELVNYAPTWNTGLDAALAAKGLTNCYNELFTAINESAANWDAQFSDIRADNERLQKERQELAALLTTRTAERDTYKALLTDHLANPIKDSNIIKDPPPFKGEGKDTRAIQMDFLQWASRIKLRWQQAPTLFNTEQRKLVHMVGLLAGEAWTNNSTTISAVMEWTQGRELPFETGDAFLTHLAQSYKVHDLNADAKTEILLFRQGDLPFATFLHKYNTLADRSGWTAEQKIDGLKVRVNAQMQAMHKNNVDDPPAGNWDAWSARFLKYSQKIAENKALQEHKSSVYGKAGQNGTDNANPSPRTSQPDPNAMDVDRMMLAKLDPAELQRRMDCGLCKRCGGSGHFARNCDGHGNYVPDRFPSYGRGGIQPRGRGRGSYRGGYGQQRQYPQYPPSTQHQPGPQYATPSSTGAWQPPPTQQLRIADTTHFPAPPSFTPPSTTPSPAPDSAMNTPAAHQTGFAYGAADERSTRYPYFEANQGNGQASH